MTLRLIVTRHAKSNWGTASHGDHARTLSERGRRASKALGHWLNDNGYRPSLVLSSDSTRTQETWAHMALSSDNAPKLVWLKELYLAPAQTILDKVQKAGNVQVVMVLGHNPGIAAFATMLAHEPSRHERFLDYPTAATTIFEFETDSWLNVDWGTGKIVDFIVPREL